MMALRFFITLLALLLSLAAAAQQRPGLRIQGVNDALADNVRLYLEAEAEEQSWGSADAVRERTARALQPFGYYHPQIRLTTEANRLTISIDRGDPVRWQPPELHIDGPAAELRPFIRLLRDHPFQPGKTMSHADYDSYRERWLALSRDYGFFEARMPVHRLVVDAEKLQATAVLRLESGPRYHFGAIHFSGGSVDEAVLRKLSIPHTGDPYRQADLHALHRTLQETGYFGSIQVRSQRTDQRTTDLHITLTDAPLDRYTVGIGFGTDTGPRARLRWQRPLVNSKGHRFESELSVSRPRSVLGAQYLIPLSHPLDHFARLSTSIENKDNEDTETRLIDVGYDIHRRLRDDWQFSYGVHLQNERYQQGNEPEQELTYLLPGTRLSRVQLSYGMDPRRGDKTWLELVGSDESLGADSAFLRFKAGYARLWSPIDRHLLIGRVELGAISTSDISRIPATQRFFTGGDETVRGFDYESLSSRDETGKLTGGRYLNVASLEYSYRFAEQWRLAGFTDAGRAFNDTSEPWHQSVGIGVRWLSPVGQVRVDLAVPIDDDRESGWRIHIFIGPPL